MMNGLADKSLTKKELPQRVKRNWSMLPEVISGVSSPKAAVRYGCAKVLMDLSMENPDKLYPYMDSFIHLLDSKHRILVWNAMAITANLAKVDKDRKFDAIFDKYYSFLNDEYMVTVVNVVGNSGKIAVAKPYLIPRITQELLKVEDLSTNPHLTEECRRVIAEKTIKSFDMFFDKIEAKDRVISFVGKQINSPRKSLKKEAEKFIRKWSQ
jgi:hypothetical protein